MSNKTLLDDCIKYFKSNKGFARVFAKMKEKYQSLGHAGGTVILQNLSDSEKDALSGLLKRDFRRQKSAAIKLENLQKSLEATRFRGLLLEEVLKGYFEDELVSNKQAQSFYEEQRNSFFEELVSKYQGTAAGEWLANGWREQGASYRTMVQRFDADRSGLMEDIDAVSRALNNLPCIYSQRLRLPVFAAGISKNPHGFDDGTPCGLLFLQALAYWFASERPQNAEERAELFYKAGILIDEVSNYVLCSGLRAYDEKGLHQGWEGFYSSGEPQMVTLMNLGRLTRVVSPRGMVFAVENPAVYTAIVDKSGMAMPLPLMCTYGQVKIASLVLMDMLVKEGTTIYYSGDFDPEGMMIADRLKARYGERLILWRFTIEDYVKAMSDKVLSESRLRKLDNLKSPSLVSLAKHIRDKGVSGYQEMLVDELAKDIFEALVFKA